MRQRQAQTLVGEPTQDQRIWLETIYTRVKEFINTQSFRSSNHSVNMPEISQCRILNDERVEIPLTGVKGFKSAREFYASLIRIFGENADYSSDSHDPQRGSSVYRLYIPLMAGRPQRSSPERRSVPEMFNDMVSLPSLLLWFFVAIAAVILFYVAFYVKDPVPKGKTLLEGILTWALNQVARPSAAQATRKV